MRRGHNIICSSCSGHGIASSWSFGVKDTYVCRDCEGSGKNWKYPNGVIAKHYAGPILGQYEPESTGGPT